MRLFLITALVAATLAVPTAAAADVDCLGSTVGVPGDTVDGAATAGAVDVASTCAGDHHLLTLPTAHTGDRFGASIAITYVNGDAYPDLLIGVPGYDVGTATDAGAVAVFTGSADGPRFDTMITQDTDDVPGSVQAGARFGSAVSAWIPNAYDGEDHFYRLMIGEPGKDVGAAVDAGGFVTLDYRNFAISTDAESETGETTLASAGVPGDPQRGDLLGSAVEALFDEAGAPGRTVAGQAGAGAVLDQDTLITQNTPCMPGVAEAGDHFGAAIAGGWFGAPGEDLGAARDAGMVERYGFTSSGKSQCYGLNQAVPRMSGTPETGDRFGAALFEVHGYQDDFTYYPEALLIGVPGEDTGTHVDSGFVNVVSEVFDPDDMGAGTVHGAGSTAGPNATGAAYGSAFGAVPTDGDNADIAAPGGSGLVYQVHYSYPHPLAHLATFRPTTSVPAGTYGTALGTADH